MQEQIANHHLVPHQKQLTSSENNPKPGSVAAAIAIVSV